MRLACGRDSPRRRRHRHGADRQRAGPPGHGLFPSVRDHLPLKDSGLQRPQFFASGFGHSAPFRDFTQPQRQDPSRCKPRAIAMQLFTYAAANAPKAVDPFAQVLVLIVAQRRRSRRRTAFRSTGSTMGCSGIRSGSIERGRGAPFIAGSRSYTVPWLG
jgi:hypothetical protein